MIVQEGRLIPFVEYLERARPQRERPVIWHSRDIWAAANEHGGHARGSVALTRDSAADKTAIAPGLSLTAQIVEPGTHAPVHSHSFWHLYFVQRGEGHIAIDSELDLQSLHTGDWLFVPAWCVHAIDNRAGTVPLELIVLQNLPQNAALGNLARADQDKPIQLTYSAS